MTTKKDAHFMDHGEFNCSAPRIGIDDITAAILAGGLGTRLRETVSDRPKALANVHGRPFLSYQLDFLADAGIRSVVLLTGYLGEMIEAEFGNSYRGLKITYSREMYPLGTAGSIRKALPLFWSETVMVLNGDSFCEVDLKSFWEWHAEKSGNATILLNKVTDTTRYGRVYINSDGQILQFKEKKDVTGPGWINAGVYLLKKALLHNIPKDQMVSLEQDIFPSWIGRAFYGYQTEGRFIDIGTPESYSIAERFFSNNLKTERKK